MTPPILIIKRRNLPNVQAIRLLLREMATSRVTQSFLAHYLLGQGRSVDISQFGATAHLRKSPQVARMYRDLIDRAKRDIPVGTQAICGRDPNFRRPINRYSIEVTRPMDFTREYHLFSIGNTRLNAVVDIQPLLACSKATIGLTGFVRFKLRDSFIDVLDIHDQIEGAQDVATPYNFYAAWAETVNEKIRI